MNISEIDRLLAELNEWERKYGPLGAGKFLATTGEAPARIAVLKRQLFDIGVGVEWDGDKYVIVSGRSNPGDQQ